MWIQRSLRRSVTSCCSSCSLYPRDAIFPLIPHYRIILVALPSSSSSSSLRVQQHDFSTMSQKKNRTKHSRIPATTTNTTTNVDDAHTTMIITPSSPNNTPRRRTLPSTSSLVVPLNMIPSSSSSSTTTTTAWKMTTVAHIHQVRDDILQSLAALQSSSSSSSSSSRHNHHHYSNHHHDTVHKAAAAVRTGLDLLQQQVTWKHNNNISPEERRSIIQEVCDPRFHQPLFACWHFVSLQRSPNNTRVFVRPGRQVLQLLMRLSQTVPPFQYDISTINRVLEVIYHQLLQQSPSSCRKAPLILENLWHYLLRQQPSLQRDVDTYALFIRAYGESVTIEPSRVERKIQDLLHQMTLEKINPNNIHIYHHRLRFHARAACRSRGPPITALRDLELEMMAQSLPLDLTTRYLLLSGYVTSRDHLHWGEAHWWTMVQKCQDDHPQPLDRCSRQLLVQSAHYILEAYSKVLHHNNHHQQQQYHHHHHNHHHTSTKSQNDQIVARAESIVQQLELHDGCRENDPDSAMVLGSLMNVYRQVRDIRGVTTTLRRIAPAHRNIVTYRIVMDTYRQCQEPRRAQKVLRQLVQRRPDIRPDIHAFNIVIRAWAESNALDATTRAFAIFRWIEKHSKCRPWDRIRPDQTTYNALLKCLATAHFEEEEEDKVPTKSIAIQAQDILNDMERLANNDPPQSPPHRRWKPSAMSYTLAIRACFRVNDSHRAESILRRMELSETPPDRITFNMILKQLSNMGTTTAAEKASQLLQYMIATSQQQSSSSSRKQELSTWKGRARHSSSPAVAPNLVSYSRVIIAWAGSGDDHASDHIWRWYQLMVHDEKISLDMEIYSKILAFLSKTNRITDLTRAINVLEAMEQQSVTCDDDNLREKTTNPSQQQSRTGAIRPEVWQYHSVIRCAIDMQEVDMAAQIVRQCVVAYTQGQAHQPDPTGWRSGWMYRVVVQEYIRRGQLIAATNFLIDVNELAKTHISTRIQKDVVLKLIKAWNLQESKSSDPPAFENVAKLRSIVQRGTVGIDDGPLDFG